jgi:hypothetical protein
MFYVKGLHFGMASASAQPLTKTGVLNSSTFFSYY